MKLNLALIFSIVLGVGLVTFGFSFFQISSEKSRMKDELEIKTAQIADKLDQNDLSNIKRRNTDLIKESLNSLTKKYNLVGIAVYYAKDSIIATSDATPLVSYSINNITRAVAREAPRGTFFKTDDRHLLMYVRPIEKNAIVLYSDAEYLHGITREILFRNFFRWFIQALVISFIIVLIIRWGIFNPVNKFLLWIKEARTGKITEMPTDPPPASILAPLHKEIIDITKAMQDAKISAEEEAILRSKGEAIWTPERLKAEMGNLLQGKKMIVVSNREPYMHIHEGKNIKFIVPASGLITAMEPILEACGGLWIASGTGDADKETVDKEDKLQVPPEDPKYTLRRLWQTKEDELHFYYGFSNEGLWPLCHIAHTRPVFRMEDWQYYKKVNEDFARAVLEETVNDDRPFILIQDYHFALLPELVKKGKPDARVAIFWHIPWPNPESFGICPWQREILTGMLGADLIGFHTQYHCNHFLETVNTVLESRVAWDNFSVEMAGHTTFVKPFPISISFTLKDFDSKTNHIKSSVQLLGEQGITGRYMGVGVDRIDYTKGIIEKFLSVERFLEKYPDYQGKFTFVQIGAPSRTLLKNYSDTVSQVEKEAERINTRFKSKNWKPILLLKRHHSHEEIKPFYASADFCMVSSLHDGMNLVAKEYVATRNNNTGVLILSRFAGASQELQGALIINPYDIENSADTIKMALEMRPAEQNERITQMRQAILKNNIYSWASGLLGSMANLQT